MGRHRPTILTKAVDFPVYGLDFMPDNRIIAAGGSGHQKQKSGVKNKVTVFEIDERQNTFIDGVTLSLPDDEDCPMSIACHPELPLIATGANESYTAIQSGENRSCRLLALEDDRIVPTEQVMASPSKNPENYQNVTRFSASGRYLVTGCTDGRVSVFKVPELVVAFPPVRYSGVQDCDVDPLEQYLVVATPKTLFIQSIYDGTVVQVIDSPKMNKRVSCEFSGVRYASSPDGRHLKLYATVNPTDRGRGFVCVWSAKRYPVDKPTTASVCRKTITSFAVSPAGDLLAYASSDLTIGFVDASTLQPLFQIKHAHGFAVTSLAFNHSGRYLASAGSDTQCRVIVVPEHLHSGGQILKTFLYAILSFLMLLLLWYTASHMH